VARLQPLSFFGLGSVPIQVASVYEGMSSLYTLVWGGDPSCHVYKITFETVQKFPYQVEFTKVNLVLMFRNY